MSGPIDSKDVIAFKHYYGYAPEDGPRFISLLIDFTFSNPQVIDFTLQQMADKVEWIQSVFIDNSAGTGAITITPAVSGQPIIVPANSQGYFPILCPNPPRFTVQQAGTAQANVRMLFLTSPVPLAVWSVAQPASFGTNATPEVIAAQTGSFTDASGTITAGGASQQLWAANLVKRYFRIENPTTATEALYVNFTTAAGLANGSYSLAPGSFLTSDISFVSTEQVNVYAATTGHAFTAKYS